MAGEHVVQIPIVLDSKLQRKPLTNTFNDHFLRPVIYGDDRQVKWRCLRSRQHLLGIKAIKLFSELPADTPYRGKTVRPRAKLLFAPNSWRAKRGPPERERLKTRERYHPSITYI